MKALFIVLLLTVTSAFADSSLTILDAQGVNLEDPAIKKILLEESNAATHLRNVLTAIGSKKVQAALSEFNKNVMGTLILSITPEELKNAIAQLDIQVNLQGDVQQDSCLVATESKDMLPDNLVNCIKMAQYSI